MEISPNNQQRLKQCWKVNRSRRIRIEHRRCRCRFCFRLFEDLGMDEEEDVTPLPNVNSAILKKVNQNTSRFCFVVHRMNRMFRLFNGQHIIKTTLHHLKMMKIEKKIRTIFHHGIKIFSKLIKEHFLN